LFCGFEGLVGSRRTRQRQVPTHSSAAHETYHCNCYSSHAVSTQAVCMLRKVSRNVKVTENICFASREKKKRDGQRDTRVRVRRETELVAAVRRRVLGCALQIGASWYTATLATQTHSQCLQPHRPGDQVTAIGWYQTLHYTNNRKRSHIHEEGLRGPSGC
jgi:hypothetical protein